MCQAQSLPNTTLLHSSYSIQSLPWSGHTVQQILRNTAVPSSLECLGMAHGWVDEWLMIVPSQVWGLPLG